LEVSSKNLEKALRRAAGPLWILIVALVAGCSSDRSPAPPTKPPAVTQSGVEWFAEEAAQTGLDFIHFNGMTGRFYQTEIMGPGVGLFDYDNDGDLDVYLVQGRTLGDGKPLVSPPASLEDRLYRNDLDVKPDGTRTLRFTDVTAASGIKTRGYGMGVAAGDIDNDGWIDLYVTGFGRNQMFRNRGDGTFVDVSSSSGTGDSASWGVSAAFVDIDRDGWLDLFVGNYLQYSIATHVACVSPAGLPDYCRPSAYRPQASRLYRNLGGGRFHDVTIASGVARQFGPALGVATADFNGDGWIDLFVANDEQENQLWINQRDGTFLNTALAAGAALGPAGERKANMGVDAGDFDGDGDEDVFVTELIAQGSTLYVNDGSGSFEEQSIRTGIRRPTLPYTGFGTAWLDFDNDGSLDILAVNGEVNRNAAPAASGDPFPLGQRNQLLRNAGGRFEDVTAQAGKVFELVETSRGAAFGDVDNDGDTDVVVGNAAGRVRLLMNQIGSRHHWIGLRLVGRTLVGRTLLGPPTTLSGPPRRDVGRVLPPPLAPNSRELRRDRRSAEREGGLDPAMRDMLGTRVAITRADGSVLWRRARADGSYASANDPRVLVGLGSSTAPPRVRVVWPDGRTDEWPSIAVDRYTTLIKGEGK
jgi:hypothetical protein